MKSDWTQLPLEILQIVFNQIEAKDRSRCALVCRSWLKPAQIALYSKVKIKDKNLFKFTQTAKESDKGTLIKAIDIDASVLSLDDTKFIDIMQVLCDHLPRLETFDCNHEYYYMALIDALLASRLPLLNNITVPFRIQDFDDYGTCALILKDRLKHLYISDGNEFDRFETSTKGQQSNCLIQYQRLLRHLDQFQQLNKISVIRDTVDGIDCLESICDKSVGLKKLSFELNHNYMDKPMSIHAHTLDLSYIAPRTNIKSLHGESSLLPVENMLSYIMHTFTELNCLKFSYHSRSPQLTPLEDPLLNQFIAFTERIPKVGIYGFELESTSVVDIVGNAWKNSGTRSVQANFSYETNVEEPTVLCLTKSPSELSTEIYYRNQLLQLEHIVLLETYGKFIDSLLMTEINAPSVMTQTAEGALDLASGQFIVHVLDHCINIKTLTILSCTMRSIDLSIGGSDQRISKINKLSISDSKVDGSVLEQLSTQLTDIHCLDLKDNIYSNTSAVGDDDLTAIVMQSTTIHSLYLSNCIGPGRKRYICLEIVTQTHGSSYYHYDFDVMQDQVFVLSNKQEHLQFSKHSFHVLLNLCTVKVVTVCNDRGTITLKL